MPPAARDHRGVSRILVHETPPTTVPSGASRRGVAVCAVDDDGHALDVIATGAHLAAAGRLDLVFVHVVAPAGVFAIAGEDVAQSLLAEAADRGYATLRRLGLGGAHALVEVSDDVPSALRSAARSYGASLIVVGAGPGGALRRALGFSVTNELLRGGGPPVVVARGADELGRADGPVIAAVSGRGRAPRLSASWGARLASVLDRPLVLALVGGEEDARRADALVESTGAQAAVTPGCGRDVAAGLEEIARDLGASAVALSYPRGRLDAALGRGRIARRLAKRCTAPVAVVPPVVRARPDRGGSRSA